MLETTPRPQDSTSAPTFSFATLREVVAELEAAHPERGRRYQAAATIVALRQIDEAAAGPGAWWVQSESDPTNEYYVVHLPEFDRWICNCADFQQRGGPCKHGLAVQLFFACLERERGPEPPPLALPFCEDDPDAPIGYELTEAAIALLDAPLAVPA